MSGRVCIIGAGPSGLSAINAFLIEKKKENNNLPEVICYEKQKTMGGVWNYTWKTGIDENGEMVHASMYRHLWSNAPKECLEYPDYSFEEHFNKIIPSFVPREAIYDYLISRFKREDIENYIKFNHTVKKI